MIDANGTPITDRPSAQSSPAGTRRTLLGTALGALASTTVLAVPAHAAANPSAQDANGVRRVADRAMDRFDHGWRSGDWDPFLALLTPRFSFWFPEGQWRGRHEGEAGRRAIEEWARFHADNGNRVHGERTNVNTMGDRVLYEYDSRGASPSTAGYLNWETIIVRVKGERISALHEYWGNIPPTDA
ncbi:ketosteroid isomerase-like protein [Thermocatellispora tengchongensis]|uniref:Ketosteroid isomerase-like protein n=1 Tax=Thermocatellispora tengchongensis TaxID=1073253 RepID=A0A840PEA3_9ACTN|nr:nuclear transport factor 2 family protein [Thermocatellispora tengchongensis]MBB5137076.1 ketosteroid isomerase-like protein [Thermocatellispora tengchongensis]